MVHNDLLLAEIVGTSQNQVLLEGPSDRQTAQTQDLDQAFSLVPEVSSACCCGPIPLH